MHEKTTAPEGTLGGTSQHENVQEQPPSANNELIDQESVPDHAYEDERQAGHLRGPAGYAHLAEFMTATHRGMVRRYKEISLMNLLYLQAEIHHLKTELKAETEADARQEGGERLIWDYHWFTLASSGERDVAGGRRWQLWLNLRGKLYEYYDAMEKHKNMLALPRPSDDHRDMISQYVARDSWNGRRCAFLSAELRGEEPEAYAEKNLGDLVFFGDSPEPNDALERWVVEPIMDGFHRIWPWAKEKRSVQEDLEANHSDETSQKPELLPYFRLIYYSNRQHRLLKKIAQAVLSILLPCAAIVSLNAVDDQNKRVGMVCGFGILFCIGMSICSSARRIEIFAATAAFMSVQLVFVGGNGDGNGGT